MSTVGAITLEERRFCFDIFDQIHPLTMGSSVRCALALVLIICSSYVCNGLKVTLDKNIVNKDVQRKVDLTSSVTRISNEVTIENNGKANIETYIFAVERSNAGKVASVVAASKSRDTDGETLSVRPVTTTDKDEALFYEVTLSKPLAPRKTVSIVVKASFSHSLVPFPAEIKQAEKQLVKYSGNLYFFSPYATTSQKTVVSLASAAIESYTKVKPNVKSDSTITYGPFENRAAYDVAELSVHFENNTPFLTVTSMTRVIEVSHWGNIAVEETYDVRHTGAKLKGSFSRYDYQKQASTFSSVKSFKTVLPASAADVYYRDEIGNISTSNMREMDDAVELELRPRFPLFGGWKTHYVIGYNVPSYQYLWTDGGNGFSVKMPFVDHIFDNQVVDHLTVKIILPEGSDVSNDT